MPTRSCATWSRPSAGPGAIIESDYDGIYELYGGFGYASSPKEAALRAFVEGGVHIDLCSLLYLRHLPELVEEGRLGEEQLLVRAAEMLHCKERVGLLDDPLPWDRPRPRCRCCSPAPPPPTATWRRPRWCCLRPTRPDPAVLPIPTAAGEVRLCVLGPLARRSSRRTGSAPIRATPTAISSGSRRRLRGSGSTGRTASYARGCDYDDARRRAAHAPREAAALAREATHVVLFLGEPHKWSGELATLAEPRLPYVQRRLVERVRRANRRRS